MVFRWLSLFTALLALAGILASCYTISVNPFADWPQYTTVTQKLFVQASYFTTWSALLTVIVAFSFYRGAATKADVWHAALRIDAAMMGITTALVYNFIIYDGLERQGLAAFVFWVNHTIAPSLMFVLWLMSMRQRSSYDLKPVAIRYALAIPTIWVVFTFIKGILSGGYYPYSFMNPLKVGYPVAFLWTVGIYAALLLIMAMLSLVERILVRSTPTDDHDDFSSYEEYLI